MSVAEEAPQRLPDPTTVERPRRKIQSAPPSRETNNRHGSQEDNQGRRNHSSSAMKSTEKDNSDSSKPKNSLVDSEVNHGAQSGSHMKQQKLDSATVDDGDYPLESNPVAKKKKKDKKSSTAAQASEIIVNGNEKTEQEKQLHLSKNSEKKENNTQGNSAKGTKRKKSPVVPNAIEKANPLPHDSSAAPRKTKTKSADRENDENKNDIDAIIPLVDHTDDATTANEKFSKSPNKKKKKKKHSDSNNGKAHQNTNDMNMSEYNQSDEEDKLAIALQKQHLNNAASSSNPASSSSSVPVNDGGVATDADANHNTVSHSKSSNVTSLLENISSKPAYASEAPAPRAQTHTNNRSAAEPSPAEDGETIVKNIGIVDDSSPSPKIGSNLGTPDRDYGKNKTNSNNSSGSAQESNDNGAKLALVNSCDPQRSTGEQLPVLSEKDEEEATQTIDVDVVGDSRNGTFRDVRTKSQLSHLESSHDHKRRNTDDEFSPRENDSQRSTPQHLRMHEEAISGNYPMAALSHTEKVRMGSSDQRCSEYGSRLHGSESGSEVSSSSDTETEEQGGRPKAPFASCCVDRSDPDSWMDNPPRRHGLQRPLHLFQIIAFFIKFLGVAFFWSSVFPGYILLYTDGHHGCLAELIVFSILIVIGMVCLITGWTVVTFKENGDYTKQGELCTYCRRKTLDDSKHCKSCNKCVAGFDHHCKWLNMCVGKSNYRYFMLYVVSAVTTMTLAMITGIVILAKWWHQLAAHNVFFRVGPIILCVVMLIGLPLIVHLLGFHIMLNIRGLSTYDYIIQKRDRAHNAPPKEPSEKKRKLFKKSKKGFKTNGDQQSVNTNNNNDNTAAADSNGNNNNNAYFTSTSTYRSTNSKARKKLEMKRKAADNYKTDNNTDNGGNIVELDRA